MVVVAAEVVAVETTVVEAAKGTVKTGITPAPDATGAAGGAGIVLNGAVVTEVVATLTSKTLLVPPGKAGG